MCTGKQTNINENKRGVRGHEAYTQAFCRHFMVKTHHWYISSDTRGFTVAALSGEQVQRWCSTQIQNQRSIQPAYNLNKRANCIHSPNLMFCMVTQGAGLVNSEQMTQWVSTSGADIIEDDGGFGIQMTDDKEFTGRRWAEQSCTWGRRDGATFSNHCDSAAIECSFVILCWLYFQMTRISISLRKGTAEFHICNVFLLCSQFVSVGPSFFCTSILISLLLNFSGTLLPNYPKTYCTHTVPIVVGNHSFGFRRSMLKLHFKLFWIIHRRHSLCRVYFSLVESSSPENSSWQSEILCLMKWSFNLNCP